MMPGARGARAAAAGRGLRQVGRLWAWWSRPLPLDEDVYQRARLLVTLFYVAAVANVHNWLNLSQRIYGWRPELGIWLTAWIDPSTAHGLWLLATGLLAASALVAAVWPGLRAARALYCLSLLLCMAMYYDGKGKIDHGYHTWWWISLVLVFLPPFDRSDRGELRQAFVRTVWTAQLMLLLTYTMAGLSKVGFSLARMLFGHVSWFHSDGLRILLLRRLESGAGRSHFSELLLGHEWVTFAMQLGVLYIECFAIVAAFRRSLTRPWAIALAALHLGIAMTMRISFPSGTLVLLLFVLLGPWGEPMSPRRMLRDLPLFGVLLRRWL